MPFSFFKPENAAQNVTGKAQVGVNDVDANVVLERAVQTPWTLNSKFSWLDYRCWIEVHLDPGMALHKPLPQASSRGNLVDSLASGFIDDPAFDGNIKGVNTTSVGTWTDMAQRMATSEYRFVLKGYAMRAGYQIPVPGLKTVAGVPAIPDNPQWSSGNILVANMSGIPLWTCRWELWYFVVSPPQKQQLPPPNIADHIAADVVLPKTVQVPWSQPDANAVAALPGLKPGVVPK